METNRAWMCSGCSSYRSLKFQLNFHGTGIGVKLPVDICTRCPKIHIRDKRVGHGHIHLKRIGDGYTHLWGGYREGITVVIHPSPLPKLFATKDPASGPPPPQRATSWSFSCEAGTIVRSSIATGIDSSSSFLYFCLLPPFFPIQFLIQIPWICLPWILILQQASKFKEQAAKQ